MARPLLITPGDPLGIGPEVACRALRDHRGPPAVLVGDHAAIERAADAAGLSLTRVDGPSEDGVVDGTIPLWDPGDADEPVEVAAIRAAVKACLDGSASGLVTGPIHKARLAARGFGFPGHTDFLGHLCGVDRPVMAFVGGRLKVALVTVHLPLRAVPDALTTDAVLHTVRVAHHALRHQLGLASPRLAVCGLNPHAGDDGLLGHEDRDLVAPAVLAARAEGLDARGPISAEGAFLAAMRDEVDLVVAMYHDQGLAPLKAVDFGKSVNWTLGLPIVRTSVDHGTADDLVGTGRADPSSMQAAIALAARLVR